MAERGSGLGEHGSEVADLATGLAAGALPAGLRVPADPPGGDLHDVGKLAIPDAILEKPGPLDEAEWQFIGATREIGERILGEAPALRPVGSLVRASHERWDGTRLPGRPRAASEIPLGARIVALCDAYDAMITDRAATARRAATRPRSPSCALAPARSSTPRSSSP